MEKEEFFQLIDEYCNKLEIMLHVEQKEQFYKYMKLLIEWNEKINLTAIVEPKDIILKHFIDSITISKYIDEKSYVADIGTGAGFPGIPLKIIRDDIKIDLVDSLNKRIKFLDCVIDNLGLKNINTIHARAEELGRDKNYREKYDVVTARAVSNLSTLSEYMIPLAKINGKCLCMKGPDVADEIKNAKVALNVLCGTLSNSYNFKLPNSNIERTIVEIKKVNSTNSKYPRKAGLPSKEPL